MRIGIDTHFLKPGRTGGSETYTRSLISTLGRIDHQNHYRILTPPHNHSLFHTLPVNFCVCLHHYAKCSTGLDLIHYPGTTMQPPTPPIPTIITIHDLQHLYWPGYFSLRERFRRWRRDRPSIHKADHIIAISNFTRQTIIEKFPTAAPKVTAIHSGVSADFFHPIPQPTEDALIKKYNLPPTFALYPARPWPHKNHKRLFAAMKILRDHFHSNCRLVLCGFTSDETPADWQPLLNSLGNDTVQLVSYIPKEEMPALYQTANLLIYPSLFEGFGLPVLEAMAARCPVICSNTTALPEIAGEAAVLIDPFDTYAIAQAMHALLTDTDRRENQVEKGVKRAAAFTWEKTAKATLDIYKGVGR